MMENLSLIWEKISAFFGQRENIMLVLWIMYVLSWLAIVVNFCLLPYKIKRIKAECRRQQGWIVEGDGFFIKIRKIKLN